MRIATTNLILTIIILFANKVYSQDLHFSQFYQTPLYINPAYAGTDENARLILLTRQQWDDSKNNYPTYTLSGDISISSGYGLDLGFGIYVDDDSQAGNWSPSIHNPLFHDAVIHNYTVNPMLSVGGNLGKMNVYLGFKFTFGWSKLDNSNLIFPDQINEYGDISNNINEYFSGDTKKYKDIGIGVMISPNFNKKCEFLNSVHLGVSCNHIINNLLNDPFINGGYYHLPYKKWIIHGDFSGETSDKALRINGGYFRPGLEYIIQKPFNELIINMNFLPDFVKNQDKLPVFIGGIGFRHGVIKFNEFKQYRDLVFISIGWKPGQVGIIGSWDFPTSKNAYTTGTFELSLRWDINLYKKESCLFPGRNLRESRKVISCPTFL